MVSNTRLGTVVVCAAEEVAVSLDVIEMPAV